MDIFNLKIARYLCPYCGRWHEFKGNNKLKDFSSFKPLILYCPITKHKGIYSLFKCKDQLYMGFFPCLKDTDSFFRYHINGQIYIPENSSSTLIFVFTVRNINKNIYLPIDDDCICRECLLFCICNKIELAKRFPREMFEISLGFEFEVPKN